MKNITKRCVISVVRYPASNFPRLSRRSTLGLFFCVVCAVSSRDPEGQCVISVERGLNALTTLITQVRLDLERGAIVAE